VVPFESADRVKSNSLHSKPKDYKRPFNNMAHLTKHDTEYVHFPSDDARLGMIFIIKKCKIIHIISF